MKMNECPKCGVCCEADENYKILTSQNTDFEVKSVLSWNLAVIEAPNDADNIIIKKEGSTDVPFSAVCGNNFGIDYSPYCKTGLYKIEIPEGVKLLYTQMSKVNKCNCG